MKDREKFDLRQPLFAWSLGLALFSITGFSKIGIRFINLLLEEGFYGATCTNVLLSNQPGLWTFLFVLSKVVELFDTYFIVLRKQKLILLHWYHHITVLMYCWYQYCGWIVPGQWFLFMNYGVHTIMYSYYAIRASGILRPPIWVNMFITFLQLLQMFIGVIVNVYVYTGINTGWYCDGRAEYSASYVYWSFAMYFSYFILFAHFFYVSYLRPPKNNNKKIEENKPKDFSQVDGILKHNKSDIKIVQNGVQHR